MHVFLKCISLYDKANKNYGVIFVVLVHTVDITSSFMVCTTHQIIFR